MRTAEQLRELVANAPTLEKRGRVVRAIGTTVWASGLDVSIGQRCMIVDPASRRELAAEVVGLDDGQAILTPFGTLAGIGPGAEVVAGEAANVVRVGEGLLGRVLDAHGKPIDGMGDIEGPSWRQPIYADPPLPLSRPLIGQPFVTGVKAIDALLTMGRGQRMGVFAMAGTGKSTLLGMIARHATADIRVIALIGERGREVGEFLDDALGEEGRRKTIVVVSTSDRPAMERVQAAHLATAIAEGFRGQGRDVLLMMDSVTRFARALREIGLAIGEPPVRRGFPPSVFAELPKLFERAGTAENGSITALYTVLLEEEEGGDPIGEEVRSILDGHIYLAHRLAEMGHYPAIDVLASISRVAGRVTSAEQRTAASACRKRMAKYADVEFLLKIGDYAEGSDPEADDAIARKPAIDRLLRQEVDEPVGFAQLVAELEEVA